MLAIYKNSWLHFCKLYYIFGSKQLMEKGRTPMFHILILKFIPVSQYILQLHILGILKHVQSQRS